MNLELLGWSEFFAHSLARQNWHGYTVGRVAREHKTAYILYT